MGVLKVIEDGAADIVKLTPSHLSMIQDERPGSVYQDSRGHRRGRGSQDRVGVQDHPISLGTADGNLQ